MKTCICTVIKDEQEYLDEWIRYHLALGIGHIFIFEDIGSTSHIDITKQYIGKVSLNSIFEAYKGFKTEQEVFDLYRDMPYHQMDYFVQILKYLQRTYPNAYDWCFVIDNDEFVTFENNDCTLDEVLSLFEGYDAFIMRWKNYGANGFITKPNYGGCGVVDIYKEEAKGEIQSTGVDCTKTCYNLHTFNESYFAHVHQPSGKCKWCNSDLKPYRARKIYKNIYLRHYMTRSWEEYVWKLNVRGDIVRNNRKYDDFFALNPDLLERKEELLGMIDNIITKAKKEEKGHKSGVTNVVLK